MNFVLERDDMKKLTVIAINENLDQVQGFIDAELEAVGCDMKVQLQIDVAVEELYTNICNYAYPKGEGTAEITIDTEGDPPVVEISLRDTGKPYNPLEKPDPDVDAEIEDKQIGGLGIYMVKNSMDELKYEYTDGQNVNVIVKRL